MAPGTGTPPGSVTFTIDSALHTVGLDSTGTATYSQSFSVQGPHPVGAAYNSSDARFSSLNSSASLSQSVLPGTTTTLSPLGSNPMIGQAVTLTATVAGAGSTPIGTVTFSIDGVAQTAVNVNASGVAPLSYTFLTAGAHVVSATFNGQANTYAPSTATALNVTVNKVPSASALYDLSGTTVFGQRAQILVSVTSSVSGTPTPTGLVQFLVSYNGGAYGLFADGSGNTTFALNPNGQVFMPINSFTPAGKYNFVVSYGGDANYSAGSSAVLGHTVNQSQTTAVAFIAAATQTSFGEVVTFYAAVQPVAPGAGTPTGSVQFVIDGSPVSPIALNSSGMAGLYNVSLASGNHTLGVVYSGDLDFLASSYSTTITITGTSSGGRQS
jgi:hypothetical protein